MGATQIQNQNPPFLDPKKSELSLRFESQSPGGRRFIQNRRPCSGDCVFRDLEELMMAIGTYIDRHNQSPKPFIWTARATPTSWRKSNARAAL
jgi:hypothetical protein